MWRQHGSPSAMRGDLRCRSARAPPSLPCEPPGMIDGPLSAPSSPPETPTPKKWMPFSFERLFAALRVGPERIAAVDDDVAGLEQRDELVDDRIDRRAGLDHDLRLARALQRLRRTPRASSRRRNLFPLPRPAANFSVTAVVRLIDGDVRSPGSPCSGRGFRPSRRGRSGRCHRCSC